MARPKAGKTAAPSGIEGGLQSPSLSKSDPDKPSVMGCPTLVGRKSRRALDSPSTFRLSAPDLSRAVGFGFTQRLVPRNRRSIHAESYMVATPQRLKTGADGSGEEAIRWARRVFSPTRDENDFFTYQTPEDNATCLLVASYPASLLTHRLRS